MNRYRARVHRENPWWVIIIDGIGATQTKRLDQVEYMARDLVAAMEDIDADDVQVDVDVQLAPGVDDLLTTTKTAAEAARAAQQTATELGREAVCRLAGEQLSLRDIAALVGLSFQRVHQLLARPATADDQQASKSESATPA